MYSLQVGLCGSAYVEDQNPDNEFSYRAIFDFNTSAASLLDGEQVLIFRAFDFTPVITPAFEIRLVRNDPNNEIHAVAFTNSGAESGTIMTTLPDTNTHSIGIGFSTSTDRQIRMVF